MLGEGANSTAAVLANVTLGRRRGAKNSNQSSELKLIGREIRLGHRLYYTILYYIISYHIILYYYMCCQAKSAPRGALLVKVRKKCKQ
eukprot:SAG31_NODE_939_length_10873_cov_5.403843_2_plen_88_part_00